MRFCVSDGTVFGQTQLVTVMARESLVSVCLAFESIFMI